MTTFSSPAWFGSYRLSSRIGTGGMGEVYLGRRSTPEGKLGEPVAIKRLFPHLAKEPSIVRMFLNEARITAQVDHPNVVKVLELGQVDGEPFIAMELLEGHSFAEAREKAAQMGRRVPLGVTLRVLVDACRGLGAAHRSTDEQGRPLCIVHRDFSPENIHVGVNGEVKVIDFGIARAENMSAGTEPGTLKGKFFYMSPEMIAGRKVDHRADLYAAGVMLYEQLCGRRPFTGMDPEQVLNRISEGRPRPPTQFDPSVPPALEAICLKALAKDPEQRFASLEELIASVEALGGAAELATHEELGRYISSIFPVDRDPKRQTLRLAIQANPSFPGAPAPLPAALGQMPEAALAGEPPAPAEVADTTIDPAAEPASPRVPDAASPPPTPAQSPAPSRPPPSPQPAGPAQPPRPAPALTPRYDWSALRHRLLAAAAAGVLLVGGALAVRACLFPHRTPAERLAAAEATPGNAASLLESLADDPAATAAQLARAGEMLLAGSASESALTLAEGFARRFPQDQAAPLLEARAAIQLRLGKRTEAAVERARALAPGDLAPDLVLIELRQAQGDIPGAIEVLSQARKRNPKSAELMALHGKLLSQAGKLDEAAEVLAAALQRRFDAAMTAELGFVRFRQNQFDAALGLLRRAVKKDPRLFEAHYYLGAVLFHQGDVKGAERAYREAEKLAARDDPRALVSLCEVQVHGGDAKGAEATRALITSRFPEQAADLTARCQQ